MTSHTLIAGVDVHRKTNTYCLMTETGQEVTPRFTLANNRSGTQALLTKVRQVMDANDFSAEETPMTRTGNPCLRYYFCEAAFSVQSQVSEFGDYYRRKYNEATKHKHKRTVVLTARKLVRLVVRLLTNNQPFQVRKALPLSFAYNLSFSLF